ncbi:hypothetical protein CALCODRAFT_517467 [Calocera cornea HHB12733]|uniref:Uncharacterized protein n=1 Tax=Calocera cornea HHB12733 TaxID=1353952 RepID=A0A165FYE8_9BASI|nr:hypothetical protein CALCODRAFT_517467 [Calocera cornea HHB12733]
MAPPRPRVPPAHRSPSAFQVHPTLLPPDDLHASRSSLADSLTTNSLHSLIYAFPDAPLPESSPEHIPSIIVDEAAIERSVTREILEMYAGEPGLEVDMEAVVRYYLEGPDTDDQGSSHHPAMDDRTSPNIEESPYAGSLQLSIPAPLILPIALPPQSPNASLSSGSWLDVHPSPIPFPSGPTLRTPPPAPMSHTSESSFGPFQAAPPLMSHPIPFLSPTNSLESDGSDAGETVPLIRYDPGEFLILSSVNARPNSNNTEADFPGPEEDAVSYQLRSELALTRRFLHATSSAEASRLLELQVDDAQTVIEQILRRANGSDADARSHHVPSEDERLLDAMNDSIGRDSAQPRRHAVAGGIPSPPASFVQAMRDPLSALTPRELTFDRNMLDFARIRGTLRLKQQFRLTNNDNTKPVAFYIHHYASDELRERLVDEYDCIPVQFTQRYCDMIRIHPRSGVIQPAGSSIITVHVKMDGIDQAFLDLVGPTSAIQVRSLILPGPSRGRWSSNALRDLFKSKYTGRLAAAKQSVILALPPLPRQDEPTSRPARKGNAGTRLIHAQPDETLHQQMLRFCADTSVLMERVRLREEAEQAVFASAPQGPLQALGVEGRQERDSEGMRFSVAVVAVGATILAAYFMMTGGLQRGETNFTNH